MTGGTRGRRDEMTGAYVISVAARLLHMHPQTLRKYERIGLIMPSRTGGMLRLYSEHDIVRLRLIKHLIEELGLNLAGVQLALGLFTRLLDVRSGLAQVEGTMTSSHTSRRGWKRCSTCSIRKGRKAQGAGGP